ncbi:Cyclin-dependent kinases regulatory subunit 1, partial [Armadillidium nasatum]
MKLNELLLLINQESKKVAVLNLSSPHNHSPLFTLIADLSSRYRDKQKVLEDVSRKRQLLLIFRHVMLPKEIAKLVPKTHLMTETEWRALGVQQSPGWVHYLVHEP